MEKNRVFGGKCYESLASYDRESSSWRMSQLCLFAEDAKSLDRLPKSGIAQNGQLYPLETLELRISDEDGLQLPTPSSSMQKYRLKGNTQASKNLEAMARRGDFGKKGRLNPQFVEWMMGFPIGWTDLER